MWFFSGGIAGVWYFMIPFVAPPPALPAIVQTSVMLALVGIAALILYLTLFKKLKKEQTENRKRFTPPPTFGPGPGSGNSGGSDKTSSDDEIFKGYGL